MIRIGVAGAGAWGRNLLRNIAANPTVELTAICDTDDTARCEAGRLHASADTYDTFEKMLRVAGLDAVVVATPPLLHFEQANLALTAGLHVLVEKPMCTNAHDARSLIALARAQGRVLMAGHTFLYSNLVHEVKRRIDSGELGEILYIHSQRLNLGRVRRDVDALWNFAPHDISITSFLLGAWPRSVNARGATFVQRAADVADTAFFQMDFEGDRFFGGHVSWLDPQKVRRMVVVGSEKMLVYDDIDSHRHVQVYDKSVELEFQSSAASLSDFRTRIRAGDLIVPNISLIEPLRVEIAEFARCIRESSQPRADGMNGLRVVCVLEALSRSMKADGAPIKVEYEDQTRPTQDEGPGGRTEPVPIEASG